jgi:hypothetical protein
MTKLTQIFLLGSAIAVSAPLALASSITGSLSIGGTDTFTTDSVTFTSNGSVSNALGDLSAFNNQTATMTPNTLGNPNDPVNGGFYFNSSADGTDLFTVTETSGNGKNKATQTLTFEITGITASGTEPLGFPNETVSGTGLLTDTGTVDYTPTDATFILSSNTNGSTTFTLNEDAAAVTPEPSSLLLLGTGLVSAAGMMIRKRRILA